VTHQNTADDFWNAAVELFEDLAYIERETWMLERIWLYMFVSYAYDDIL
jgi:hypothetical protein